MEIFQANPASHNSILVGRFLANTAYRLDILLILLIVVLLSLLHLIALLIILKSFVFFIFAVLWICSFPKKPNTVNRAAKTLSVSCLLTVHIIIEGELLSFLDIFYRKDSDTNISVNIPLLRLTIWVTAVIY